MNGKIKKMTFIWLASLLALISALPTSPAAAKGPISYDFNKSLGDWGSRTDDASKQYSFELQHDNVSPFGCAPVGCVANGYANLKFIPSVVGTGAWMLVKVPASGLEDVAITFDARDTGNCKACVLMASARSDEAVKAGQFSDLISMKDPPLDNNWQSYTYHAQVKAEDNGTAYLAIGLRATKELLQAIGSGGSAAVGFDNVNIFVYPSPPSP